MKKLFVVLMMIFAVCNNVNSSQAADVDFLFIGLGGGDIAKVNVANWDIKFLETEKSKYMHYIGMKYYSCCNKVIFSAFSSSNKYIGLINLESDLVEYVDPGAHGLPAKINNILPSTTSPNVLYFSAASRSAREVEKENGQDATAWSQWEASQEYARYDIEENTWSKVGFPGIDEITFFPFGLNPRQKMAQVQEDLNLLREKNILRADVEDDILLYSDDKHMVAQRDGKLLIIDKNDVSLNAVISSPPEFASEDKRLLRPNFVLPIPKQQ